MKRPIGHDRILAQLTSELPAVALFHGPESVGKRATAEWLRREHGIDGADFLEVPKLSIPSARDVVAFAATAPRSQRGKLAVVQLDGASSAAMNVLLKTVEEASSLVRFILITDGDVPATIRTRCQEYRFGLLTREDVSRILSEQRGFSETNATRLADLSGGQMKVALAAAAGFEEKSTVLLALKAFRERSEETLDKAAEKWNDTATDLLTRWAYETATGQYQLFSLAETEMADRGFAMKILVALNHDVRPKLAVRAGLTALLRSL